MESKLPKIIYVRDITEIEANVFLKIKSKFGEKSNSKAVKILFLKYIRLLEEHSNLNYKFEKEIEKNKILTDKMKVIKEFSKVLDELD